MLSHQQIMRVALSHGKIQSKSLVRKIIDSRRQKNLSAIETTPCQVREIIGRVYGHPPGPSREQGRDDGLPKMSRRVMKTDHSHPWCSQGEEDCKPVEEKKKKKHKNEKQSSANEHN